MTDRDKVLKGLECCAAMSGDECRNCPYTHECRDTDLPYGMPHLAAEALALLKEQGWNALTEDADGVIHGLPGDDGQYLMTDGKDIWIDDYVDGVADGIILDSGRDIREITAWMYMPELSKKDRTVK